MSRHAATGMSRRHFAASAGLLLVPAMASAQAVASIILEGGFRVASNTSPQTSFRSDGRAQPPVLPIPRGSSIVVDGQNTASEWADAFLVRIPVPGGPTVDVRVKHDGTHLLVMYSGYPSPRDSSFRVPEVVIDPRNDSRDEWNPDDWWFHASGRDCASQGRYNDYSTCVAEGPRWSASNVRGDVAPPIMELRIPFGLLGLNPANAPTIGIAFDVTDTRSHWEFWPPGAELARPATWARGVVSP